MEGAIAAEEIETQNPTPRADQSRLQTLKLVPHEELKHGRRGKARRPYRRGHPYSKRRPRCGVPSERDLKALAYAWSILTSSS